MREKIDGEDALKDAVSAREEVGEILNIALIKRPTNFTLSPLWTQEKNHLGHAQWHCSAGNTLLWEGLLCGVPSVLHEQSPARNDHVVISPA